MSTPTVDLEVSGMTCSSCVGTVERALNALPGVSASVNLATERARVEFTSDTGEAVSTDDLIRAVASAGYTATVRGSAGGGGTGGSRNSGPASKTRQLLGSLGFRLSVAATLTTVVMVLSMVPAAQFAGWQYLAAALTIPVVFYSGWPFHRAAWAALMHRTATMDTLVSLGSLVSFGWSVWVLVTYGAMESHSEMFTLFGMNGNVAAVYFETSAMLVTLILLGRWIEDRSRRRAGAALAALDQLMPSQVRLLETAPMQTTNLLAPTRQERLVSPQMVKLGDVVVVLPGERIAVDGRVLVGSAEVDESAISGESAPRRVEAGSVVTSGTLVLDARLEIQATAVGSATRMAQLTELVEQAQVAKSSMQRMADKISSVFVPVVISLALATTAFWLLSGQPLEHALSIGIAVLIIACPCALGLATPVAIMAGTGRGAQLGIIISSPDALERARSLKVVALDKTGTLTYGSPVFSSLVVEPASGPSEDLIFQNLARIESSSEHPFAKAITAEAAKRKVNADPVANTRVLPGQGIVAEIDGETWSVVRADSATLTPTLREALNQATGSAAVITRSDTPVALVSVTDQLRDDAAEAIQQLKRMKLEPVILSGDRPEVVAEVAKQLGVATWHAEMSPEAKRAWVAEQGAARPVAMVGDGINDAAALADSQLGIAISSGTDLARAASDITVTADRARAIPQAIRLARATAGTIRGNLLWAFAYNVAAIPLAMIGFMSPMLAAAAMAFSSLFVVLNSVRLTAFERR